MPEFFRRAVAALMMAALLSPIAAAHSLKVFAACSGDSIEGYAYFAGGGRAKHLEITVTGARNTTLATLQTDDDGAFAFTPATRSDHTFTVHTLDGHEAAYTVTTAELSGTVVEPETRTAVDGPVENEALEVVVARAVAAQVQPLRAQLEQIEGQLRLRDILGGIGYVVGVMGVVLFLKTRHRGVQ